MKKKGILIALCLVVLALLGNFLLTFIQSKKQDTDIPTLLTKTIKNAPFLHSFTPPTPNIKHIFVIVEENHDWASIYQNSDAPYINSTLLSQGAFATNYHNVPENMGDLHPSELNYIFLSSGQVAFPDHTFTTDDIPSADNSTASTNNLVSLLDKNGYTWKSYQEDIPGTDCPIDSVNNYAPRHNPFIYFQQVSGNPPDASNAYCKAHVRPFSELEHDLALGNVPNFAFITPNVQHDMHNGTINRADTWLSQVVPQITNSATFKKDGALFITWDEGSENGSGNNPIGMIILSPFAKKGYTNSLSYSHASLLKTIEEIFQLQPLLGEAGNKQTTDLLDFFNLPK